MIRIMVGVACALVLFVARIIDNDVATVTMGQIMNYAGGSILFGVVIYFLIGVGSPSQVKLTGEDPDDEHQ